MSDTDALELLRDRARGFVEERQWQHFQTPKNLSMAMIVEAAELVEHFQWLTSEQSLKPDAVQKEKIAEELSDVLIYLIRIADVLDIDLAGSALLKVERNKKKYPAEHAGLSPDSVRPTS